MKDLSILTVNYESYDFLDLMLHTINLPIKVVVLDNTPEPQTITDLRIKQIKMHRNIGHGEGINEGLYYINTEFVLVLDCDCHFLNNNWEVVLMNNKNYDIICGQGVPIKPIRPAVIFMRTEFGRNYNWAATKGYQGHLVSEGFDVGISAYNQMVQEGKNIKFLKSQPSIYETLNGEDWYLDEEILFYHHWHGSHLKERQIDFSTNLVSDKYKLFSNFEFMKKWIVPCPELI